MKNQLYSSLKTSVSSKESYCMINSMPLCFQSYVCSFQGMKLHYQCLHCGCKMRVGFVAGKFRIFRFFKFQIDNFKLLLYFTMSNMCEASSFAINMVIHGYHVYKDIWTSACGEEHHSIFCIVLVFPLNSAFQPFSFMTFWTSTLKAAINEGSINNNRLHLLLVKQIRFAHLHLAPLF